MFTIRIGCERQGGEMWPVRVAIAGCPRSGLEAVDFRRAAGLPEAPTNQINLPGFRWEDEEFVRAHPGRANNEADIETEGKGGAVENYVYVNGSEPKVVMFGRRQLPSGKLIGSYAGPEAEATLTAPVILAYLKEQTPQTGRALLLDLWDGERRSLEAARGEEAEALARREEKRRQKAEEEAKLEAARQLLAPEIEALQAKIAYLEGEVESLKDNLESLQGEEV